MTTSEYLFDFTIITPVYNGERWIRETVESVLSFCSNEKYEYIVVNDGSTDDTLMILNTFAEKIRIINQENQGEAASVNAGLKLGKGKYSLVVSADDPMKSSDLLREAKRIMDDREEIVCTYPDWSIIDSQSCIVRNVTVPEYDENILIGEMNCIVGPGGVFRRETALQIGGRNTHYRFTSDYDFWIRLSRHGDFKRIPGFHAYWREHAQSTSIALRGIEMGHERINVVRNFINKNQNIPRNMQKKSLGHAYYQAALLVYFDKKIPCKIWLAKSLWHFPAGIFRFDPRVVTYIILSPFSSVILEALKKIGLFKTMSKHV